MRVLLCCATLMVLVAISEAWNGVDGTLWCGNRPAPEDPKAIGSNKPMDKCCRRLKKCNKQCTPKGNSIVYHNNCCEKFCDCLLDLDDSSEAQWVIKKFFPFKKHECFDWAGDRGDCSNIELAPYQCPQPSEA